MREGKMRILLILCLLVCGLVTLCSSANQHQADTEDNEFAEFEDFEEDDEVVQDDEENVPVTPTTSPRKQHQHEESAEDDEAVVEDEDEDAEFDHFQDEEEFERYDQENKASTGRGKGDAPDLKITKVPFNLRTNWDSFHLEMLMIAGLIVYFINFIAGKNSNQKLANAWFTSHKQLLEQNFHLVGDDGKSADGEKSGLVKESENIYTLWCSGRTCCEGMLVELKLLKRQDLIHVIAQLIRPSCDQITVKVTMNPEDMDSFVFVLVNKKSAAKLAKDVNDISTYCPEKKNVEKFGLPSSFLLMSEVGEATSAILDSKITAVFTKYENNIEYIHFSDQYSGAKLPEDSQPTKLPEVKKVLLFSFLVPGRGRSTTDSMESLRPLFQLVFHCMEKVKRLRLSKEAKQKTEKNRLRVEEAFLKTTHQQRAEAAQQRREDKRRAEKERILSEDDPDKQRKWEEREHRRELKRKAPKMKQLKVKAL